MDGATNTHTHDPTEWQLFCCKTYIFHIDSAPTRVGSESSACHAYLNMRIETALDASENHNEYFICIICRYSRSYRFKFSSFWWDGMMHDRRDYFYIFFINELMPGIDCVETFSFSACTSRCSLCLGSLAFLRCTRNTLTAHCTVTSHASVCRWRWKKWQKKAVRHSYTIFQVMPEHEGKSRNENSFRSG